MTRRRIDALLLEWEGTLCDTAPIRTRALAAVLAEDGVAVDPASLATRAAGVPTATAVRAVLAGAAIAADETAIELLTLRVDRRIGAALREGLALVPGARNAVERLAARTRLGIVTRSNRAEAEQVVAAAELEHAITCIVGTDDAYPGKPSPAPYAAALRRLAGVGSPGGTGITVALEDAPAGIRAARAAGVRCIAVGPLPAHEALEADALVAALADLDLATIHQLVAREGEEFP